MSVKLAKSSKLIGGYRVNLLMADAMLPVEFHRDKYSQLGEGAALGHIFRVIGTTDKLAVEFGAWDGIYISNTAFLRKERGWNGILFDAEHDGEGVIKVRLTAANIAETFREHGVPEQFDLMSIDVDGNDFWLWNALCDFEPRVVVVEYNCTFDATESVAIKYNPYHVWDQTRYFGASLRAMWKLGKSRGYSLVGISPTLNAFFVKRELIDPAARDITPDALWPKATEAFLPDTLNRPWRHV